MPTTTTSLILCLAVAVASCGVGDGDTPTGTEPLPALAVTAQPGPLPATLRFSHLGLEDGTPQSDGQAIVQDSLGFVWIGTEGGLVRYDGERLRVFQPQPFDTTSLHHPWVRGFSPESGGDLWLALENGTLDRYDAATETFSNVSLGLESDARDASWEMIRADDGALWIGHRFTGVTRYDPETGAIKTYASRPGSVDGLSVDRVTALAQTDDRTVWVGTDDGGLHRITPDGQLHAFEGAGGGVFAPGAAILALEAGLGGRLWVGTDGAGLFVLEGTRAERVGGLSSDAVWSLLQDPAGTVWVGTDAGLERVEPGGTVTAFAHDPADPTSLQAGGVHALMLDRSGAFWVGTEEGVSRFSWRRPRFEAVTGGPDGPLSSPSVWSFLEDRDGVLWVGTEAGLDRIEDGRVTHYVHDPADPASITPGWVVSIYQDRTGRLWVGTRRGGLNLFDRETGRATRFLMDPDDPTGLPTDNPWRLFEDRSGQVWVMTNGVGCMSRFDPDTVTFEPVCLGGEIPPVKSIVEREDGVFWMATWDYGLWRYDTRTGDVRRWRHDPMDLQTPVSDNVMTVHLADDGDLWLGTYGAGLSRFDPETERFTHYTASTSDLPDNIIYFIEGDDDGHLWIGSNRGLTRFDPETERGLTFGLEDGLQDLEFNAVASYRAPDGTLYVGGIGGYNAFDPSEIEVDPVVPRAVVTGLTVDGRDVHESGVLEAAAPVTRRLRTQPGERDLEVAFGALHYVAPERNRFRYRLDGYDDVWSAPTTDGRAIYTNLDAGRYTFRVSAANPDGAWGPEARLALEVVPPWWASWWAWAVYAAAVTAVGTMLARVWERRQELQRRVEVERAESDQLRSLDEFKSQFFANVSHEFRTPLTLTLGPLEDVLADEHGAVPAPLRGPIVLAQRNAQRVLDLVNQLLDVARLEAGQVQLQARPLALEGAVTRVVDAFEPFAAQNGIALSATLPRETVEVVADPASIDKVLTNLVSNAVKFTPRGGTIEVVLEDGPGGARVQVRDSGSGIAASALPHVFDRFYTDGASGSLAGQGVGIGLALAKEHADLHGGSLTVDSVEGEGTTFTLALRHGSEHLSPNQLLPGATGSESPSQIRPLLSPVVASPADPPADLEDDITTVLVVEDHAELRAYVRQHLEPDYRVLEASDGQAGLEAARAHLPDLVLSDVMMPGLNGLELCRALKSAPETDFLPVVLLTARAERDNRLEGLAEQADDYLTKPFDPAELRARVGNLIANRRRLRDRVALEAAAHPPGGDGATAPEILSEDEVFVARLRSVLEARLGDETLTVDGLAEALHVSRSHLNQRVKDTTGETPMAFVHSVRLERAASLLEAGAGSVTEIAYAVGFKSVSHFSNRFDRHFGCRPSMYRTRSSETVVR